VNARCDATPAFMREQKSKGRAAVIPAQGLYAPFGAC
jgi:hypothetical protein